MFFLTLFIVCIRVINSSYTSKVIIIKDPNVSIEGHITPLFRLDFYKYFFTFIWVKLYNISSWYYKPYYIWAKNKQLQMTKTWFVSGPTLPNHKCLWSCLILFLFALFYYLLICLDFREICWVEFVNVEKFENLSIFEE